MPKLDKQTAKAVDAAEAGGFEALPDDIYDVILAEVNSGEGAKGPYWTWVWQIPANAEHAGRRFWQTTSLSEQSRQFVKRNFDAFGVSADTDTDLLLGRKARVKVGTEIQTVGVNAGEPRNVVQRVMSYDGPEATPSDGIPF